MSVIVWDGTTMAADRQATNGDTKMTVCKMRVIDGPDGRTLIGWVASAPAGEMMYRWFKDGAKEADFPACQKDAEDWVAMLVIKPDWSVWKYERWPLPFQILDRCAAIGSGREVALGAMMAGADAVRTVEICSRLEIHCGLGVNYASFDGKMMQVKEPV